jgi:hypothetical protein
MPFHKSNVERGFLDTLLKRFKEPAMTLCLADIPGRHFPQNCLLPVRLAFIVHGREHPVILAEPHDLHSEGGNTLPSYTKVGLP